jgi:excinuclease UvrABC nuclease subunit
MSYFEANWCSLNWSPWASFTTREKWKLIPTETGVYRVRPAGTNFIAYIGETGRQLRGRLSSLRRGTLSNVMPFNDSHTAAPNLWAWRQEARAS